MLSLEGEGLSPSDPGETSATGDDEELDLSIAPPPLVSGVTGDAGAPPEPPEASGALATWNESANDRSTDIPSPDNVGGTNVDATDSTVSSTLPPSEPAPASAGVANDPTLSSTLPPSEPAPASATATELLALPGLGVAKSFPASPPTGCGDEPAVDPVKPP